MSWGDFEDEGPSQAPAAQENEDKVTVRGKVVFVETSNGYTAVAVEYKSGQFPKALCMSFKASNLPNPPAQGDVVTLTGFVASRWNDKGRRYYTNVNGWRCE